MSTVDIKSRLFSGMTFEKYKVRKTLQRRYIAKQNHVNGKWNVTIDVFRDLKE